MLIAAASKRWTQTSAYLIIEKWENREKLGIIKGQRDK